MSRLRVGMAGAVSVSLFALLYACVGSDPDPAVEPAADASTTSSSSSSSSGNGSSSSSGGTSGSSIDAALTCESDETACAGKCVITKSSKEHCGACGHSCGGGDCNAAVCQQTVVVPNIQSESGFDVMDGFVYFISSDGDNTRADVSRCSVAGCNPAEKLMTATALGSSASDLFATGGVVSFHLNKSGTSGGSLKFCPATGCANSDLEGNGYRSVFGTSGSRFFFAGGRNGSSVLVNDCGPTKDDAGCTQTTLIDGAHGGMGSGLRGGTDGTYLTFGRGHDGGGEELALCKIATECGDGGLTVAEEQPAQNVMSKGRLFLLANPGTSQPNGKIGVCDLPCTAGTKTFASSITNLTEMAADDSDLYWLSPGPTGYDGIYSCPITGCPGSGPTTLVQKLGDEAKELRVDKGFVYWSSATVDGGVGVRDIHRVATRLKK